MANEIYIFAEKSELPIPAPIEAKALPGDEDEIFYTLTVQTSVPMAIFNLTREAVGLPLALLTYATGFSFGGRK